MRKLLLITAMILTYTLFSPSASWSSETIPPYHWTYHSLEILSEKNLIKERVVPGQSSYTKEEVAQIIISAMESIKKDPSLMGDDQLASMRQLINGYKAELESAGKPYSESRAELEDMAIAADLTAVQISEGTGLAEKALSFEAVRSVNRFTFDIYRHLAAKNSEALFISPYSISSALSMTYAGASGKTAQEMERVLYLGRDIHRSMAALIDDINTVPPDSLLARTANSLWPAKDERLLRQYIETINNYYEASLIPLDFRSDPEKARNKINEWVEKTTEGRIKNIIGEGILKRETPLVLTNTVFFKAEWMTKFEPQNSRVMPFFVAASESVPAVMMTKTESGIKYLKESDLEIAEIPYNDNRMSMLIILPQKGTDLGNIEKKLDHIKFSEWAIFMSPRKVRLTMPKFKCEQSFELGETLKELGVVSAFSPEEADFSAMNGRKNIFIGAAVHKTFVEVGEEGTEAAAATAVIMTKTSMINEPDDVVDFKADRPFIFIIKDNKTQAIIFIGRYVKP